MQCTIRELSIWPECPKHLIMVEHQMVFIHLELPIRLLSPKGTCSENDQQCRPKAKESLSKESKEAILMDIKLRASWCRNQGWSPLSEVDRRLQEMWATLKHFSLGLSTRDLTSNLMLHKWRILPDPRVMSLCRAEDHKDLNSNILPKGWWSKAKELNFRVVDLK